MTEGPFFFDPEGNPISAETWSRMADTAVRIVGLDAVGGRVVSTVWLGIDSEGRTPPLIFETLVLTPSVEGPTPDAIFDEFTRRYATAAEARAGHVETVEAVRRDDADGGTS